MFRCASAEALSSDRAIAVTAIEHGDIIITVASQIREPEHPLSATAEGHFVTSILGGPLCGERVASNSLKMMLHDHVSAVTRIAEFIGVVEPLACSAIKPSANSLRGNHHDDRPENERDIGLP
jgi:uncharacterized protein YoaH (UPF0181 family)